MTRWHRAVGALVVVAGARRPPAAAARASGSKDVVLVTHDSFAIPKAVKAAFEHQTG